MPNYPAIPDYIQDSIVFYDAYRGLCLVGYWGEKDHYWLFQPIGSTWVSQRTLTEAEEENLDQLRSKDIRPGRRP